MKILELTTLVALILWCAILLYDAVVYTVEYILFKKMNINGNIISFKINHDYKNKWSSEVKYMMNGDSENSFIITQESKSYAGILFLTFLKAFSIKMPKEKKKVNTKNKQIRNDYKKIEVDNGDDKTNTVS